MSFSEGVEIVKASWLRAKEASPATTFSPSGKLKTWEGKIKQERKTKVINDLQLIKKISA